MVVGFDNNQSPPLETKVKMHKVFMGNDRVSTDKNIHCNGNVCVCDVSSWLQTTNWAAYERGGITVELSRH